MKKNDSQKGKPLSQQQAQTTQQQQPPKSTSPEVIREMNKSTDMISCLIHEYLIKKEYNKTLDTFQEEILTKIQSKQYYKASFIEINEINLLKSFNAGNKADFFKQWNRMVPNHIKSREPAIEKLEFFLEIYFAIYPLLGERKTSKEQAQKELKQNMNEFKLYLEKREIELSKTTEFLAYYALPYVPNPREHPSYQQLFGNEWIKELKEKIRYCIKNYLPSIKYPVLYDLVSGNDKDQKEVDSMRQFLDNLTPAIPNEGDNLLTDIERDKQNEDNARIMEEYKRIKMKEEKNKMAFLDSQKTWTNFALNIVSYAFELIMLCKSNKKTNDIVLQAEQINKKVLKYQAFLKKNADELEKKNNTQNNSNILLRNDEIEMIQNSKYDDNSMMNNNNINNITTIPQDIDERRNIQVDYEPGNLIDMKVLTNALQKSRNPSPDDQRLSYIIREIRLRIFRRSNQNLKQLSLYSIFYYDLFRTLAKNNSLISDLLANPYLNLEVMKLMNSIAGLNKGRNYLLAKENLIDEIVNCMSREKIDSELRQNCLGTIQKFTLRVEPQNKLIELNVIQWIVDVFSYEAKTISDYTLEYGLALIMNLALRKAGREKYETVSDRIMQILLNYMSKESIQVHTCINGTLFALLKRQKFKEEAKKFHLDKILHESNITNPQLKKQMGYILEELENQPEEDVIEENFEEDSPKDDEEINCDEYNDADSINEDLLVQHYRILGDFILRSNEEHQIEENRLKVFLTNNPNMCGTFTNRTRSIINMSASIRPEEYDRPLRRPTTPMTNLSMTQNSQMFNDRRSFQVKQGMSALQNYNENDKNVSPPEEMAQNNEGMIGQEASKDVAKAFEKRDRLVHTPPGNNK